MVDSLFLNISCLEDSSIASLVKGKIVIYNSFIFPTVSKSISLGGGAISLRENSEAILKNFKISNVTSSKGGVINADFNSQVTINSSYFENCQGEFGAIIFLSNGMNNIFKMEMAYIFNGFAQNSLFYLQNSQTYIKNCQFNHSGNLIAAYSTFIFVQKMKIENSNCLKEKNGCIFFFSDKTISYISEIFTMNSYENLIFIQTSTLDGNNSIFKNMKGESEILFLYSDNSYIDIKNFTFLDFENSLFFLKKNSLSIATCNFRNQKNNYLISKSLITCLFCDNIEIQNSNFSGLSSITNGSCLLINQCTNIFLIINSSFTNNTSNNSGGAIYTLDSRGTIKSCSFLNNNAERGGSLAIMCTSIQCFVNLLYNIFQSNFAQLEGGAIKWYYSPPNNISSNIFINNSAKLYGSDIADRPIKFYVNIYEDGDPSKIELNSFYNTSEFKKGVRIVDQRSGKLLNKLEFFLLDYENQIYISPTKLMMKVELMGPPFIILKNKGAFSYLIESTPKNGSNYAFFYGASNILMNENNSFIFDKLNIIGTPNSTVFLKFYLPSMNYLASNLCSIIFK